MPEDFRELKLFGLDLSEIGRQFRLASEQLLYGPEAGLWDKRAPKITVLEQNDSDNKQLPWQDEGGQQKRHVALLLPDEAVLLKTERLPQSAEIHLDEVLGHSVRAISPFDADETRWGWRVSDRSEMDIELEIAVTSSSLLERCVADARTQGLPALSVVEIWARGASGVITMAGYGEAQRRSQYRKELLTLVSRYALTALVLLGLIALPSAWAAMKANQLDQLLKETEARARSVTQIRDDMLRAGEDLKAAQQFFSDRIYYQNWLNLLADLTPDSSYLVTLEIKTDRLTVNGFSENAADYQGILAASGHFSNLAAPSAFRFDSRAKRERFTLAMTLGRAQ